MTAPGLVLTISQTGVGVEIAVTGELDLSTAGSLVDAAVTVVAGRPETLVLNLAGVAFCDSSGISGLVKIRKLCDESGCGLRVANLSEQVATVLDISGVQDFLDGP